jgi:hypothetical protein
MSAQDIFTVLDYGMTGNCRSATGRSEFIAPNLLANMASTVTPSWGATGSQNTYQYLPNSSPLTRLESSLGPLFNNLLVDERAWFGRFPHSAMPAFTQPQSPIARRSGLELPQALMIPLSDCPVATGAIDQLTDVFTDPVDISVFPGVVVAYAETMRSAGGAIVTSGIAAANLESSTQDRYTIDFRTPIAIPPIKLGDTELTTTDRQGFVGTDFVDLTFTYENTTGLIVDYSEVVLYRIDNMVLVPMRRYVIADPADRSVSFDTAQLENEKEYVIAIHAYRGRPLTEVADFRMVTFPQGASTVFTRSFVKKP